MGPLPSPSHLRSGMGWYPICNGVPHYGRSKGGGFKRFCSSEQASRTPPSCRKERKIVPLWEKRSGKSIAQTAPETDAPFPFTVNFFHGQERQRRRRDRAPQTPGRPPCALEELGMIGSRDYHAAYVEERKHEHCPAHAEHLAGDAHGGQGAAGDAHDLFSTEPMTAFVLGRKKAQIPGRGA